MEKKKFYHYYKYILWAYGIFEVIMVGFDNKYGIFPKIPMALAWAVIISSFVFIALFIKDASMITKREKEACTGASLLIIICMLIYVKVMF